MRNSTISSPHVLPSRTPSFSINLPLNILQHKHSEEIRVTDSESDGGGPGPTQKLKGGSSTLGLINETFRPPPPFLEFLDFTSPSMHTMGTEVRS